MGKTKSRDTIRVQEPFHNGKHNIPRKMLEIICGFKDLEFLEKMME